MNEIMQKILANIPNILTNTSLSEVFHEAILNRLVSFGYQLQESDDWVLAFAMQKVENHIKNFCNITAIPDGLFNVAVDMTCGEFLFSKKQTGQLEISNLDLTGAIQQISEGDASVTFASSDDDKFNSMLNYLLHNGEGDFICYRKLSW